MNRRRSPRMEKYKRCFILMIFVTFFFITYVVLFVRENYEIIQKMAVVYREERDKLRIQVFRVRADWGYLAWGKESTNQTKSRNQTSGRFPYVAKASRLNFDQTVQSMNFIPASSNANDTHKKRLEFVDERNIHPNHPGDHQMEEAKSNTVGNDHNRDQNRDHNRGHKPGRRPAARRPPGHDVTRPKDRSRLGEHGERHSLKETFVRRLGNRTMD